MINTGTLAMDWSQPVSNRLRNDGQSSSDFDWSQPLSTKLSGKGQNSSDWSQPVSSKLTGNDQTSSTFDWSQPVSAALSSSGNTNVVLNATDSVSPQSGFKDNLVSNETNSGFDWSQSVSAVLGGSGLQDTSNRTEYNDPSSAKDGVVDSNNERNDADNSQNTSRELHLSENERPIEDCNAINSSESQNNDAIAQRLKFRACLKLVVEELCTLPHHCEIHNKDLRSTFTAWLKKELDLIHRICDFERDGTKTESLLPLKVSTPTAVETGRVSLKLACGNGL